MSGLLATGGCCRQDVAGRRDAEAATSTVEHALGLAGSLVIRHIRAVREACPACGSKRLSPQRGFHSSVPDLNGRGQRAKNADGLATMCRSWAPPKPMHQTTKSKLLPKEAAQFKQRHFENFADLNGRLTGGVAIGSEENAEHRKYRCEVADMAADNAE
jgi:hypothetical protein